MTHNLQWLSWHCPMLNIKRTGQLAAKSHTRQSRRQPTLLPLLPLPPPPVPYSSAAGAQAQAAAHRLLDPAATAAAVIQAAAEGGGWKQGQPAAVLCRSLLLPSLSLSLQLLLLLLPPGLLLLVRAGQAPA